MIAADYDYATMKIKKCSRNRKEYRTSVMYVELFCSSETFC